MCGTGSDDVVAEDVFVPDERCAVRAARESGNCLSGSVSPVVHLAGGRGLVSVALGVARAAIDDFIAMAKKKTPMYTATPLRERSVVQLQVAEAEAKLAAARCFLFSVLDEMWQRAKEGESLDMSARARCQLASSHAVVAAAEAVDRVYLAAGASAIRDEQPFQRYFRDVHADHAARVHEPQPFRSRRARLGGGSSRIGRSSSFEERRSRRDGGSGALARGRRASPGATPPVHAPRPESTREPNRVVGPGAGWCEAEAAAAEAMR